MKRYRCVICGWVDDDIYLIEVHIDESHEDADTGDWEEIERSALASGAEDNRSE